MAKQRKIGHDELLEEMASEMLADLGLEDDEIERELEDWGIGGHMAGNFNATTNEYAHIDSLGFAQVGRNDYDLKQRFEKKYLKYRIFELIGNAPKDSFIKWTANQHDFGTYHDMIYHYNDDNKAHVAYLAKMESIEMENLEAGCQSNWDAQQMGQSLTFLDYPHEDNKVFDLIE